MQARVAQDGEVKARVSREAFIAKLRQVPMGLALRAYNGGLSHWQREAASTGLARPTRTQVDAACGQARRAAVHCAENLGYA